MKRSRLLTLGATLSLLVATTAGGGAFLAHSTLVHAAAPNPYIVSISALSKANARPQYASMGPEDHGHGGNQGAIPNIDSLANFSGVYHVKGYDANGALTNTWLYNTVGNSPEEGGTTRIQSPIVPVSLNLVGQNGSMTYDSAQPFVAPTVSSPLFRDAQYSSSESPTQVTDAIQRAEYYHQAEDNWHTLLTPRVKQGRTMTLPYGSYYAALNPDGTCCAFVLVNIDAFSNLLFPATPTVTTTPVGAAERAGDITTKDMSTFLFPNTFLYFGTNPFAPGACCVLGYHTYDSEPGTVSNGNREMRYVLNYSSWISPGLFGGGFQDITATSHEIAESFNDPFVTSDNVHDVTPWWLAPNGNCQNNLETGDVIEGLSNSVYPMTMHGFTYHPQNEALLQWFESKPESNALHHAFSYPDETVLTSANVSQLPGCAGPA